jgi:hypothetical protein
MSASPLTVGEIEAAVIARDRVRADLIRLFERVNLLRFSTLTIKQIKIATISKKQELLQKGFNINLEDGFSAKLEISCKHKGLFPEFPVYYAQANLPVVVRCMPTSYETTKGPPPRPGRHLDIDPPITAVSVVADPPETQGRQCPVYVNFRGKITAEEKRQYSTFNTKYRIRR